MKSKRYTDEFRAEAIKQVTERGYPVAEVAQRLGVSSHSLYEWLRRSGVSRQARKTQQDADLQRENQQLRAELRRVEEERDILKKAAGVLCQGVRARYGFMHAHQHEFRITTMCRVLKVERSGYYAWLAKPRSARSIEDARLLKLIEEAYLASGGVYGSRNIHRDLIEAGERVGKHRVARLMRENGLRSVRSPQRRRYKTGKPSVVAPNRLQRQFTVPEPDHAWVTDITYLRTAEGWLYLAVVLDLYSRAVIGWSMKPTLARELALDALLMAIWRRRPTRTVTIHSDQGVQYGSDDWQRFCREHGLEVSMSRRGNCWDNSVAESFFSSLKKERIRGKVYPSRNDARSDVFDYIEVFYNRQRRHGHNGGLSPMAFEEAHPTRSL
ncbi:IS3 family transposase [Pseudomonas aeruginosa]|uniref:IS3 family transposase n=8 Tax=Burkholderiaceae TaxID=119060 RepID=A0ABD4UQI7_9BURK|nr:MULTISPECIES: IS3 family transposase [Burkholderiaceae]MCS7573587.1 IS3 family transposase [Pseudomonas aeruginosa]HDB7619045.1 IS3 family transposase [Staphylococcus aureus]MBO4120635.1 IS3 family transposase [Cupriavidus gilardii]MBR8030364.1 IS3 family transposase [Burkholderia cenocepacia]MCT1166648.1 IS3 family transposase [Pseudomonas aeruginosa]